MKQDVLGPEAQGEAAPDVVSPTAGQHFQRLLLAGLVVLAPVALTLFILYQVFILVDGIFEPLVIRTVGTHLPGIGLLLTLILVLILGWLSTNVLGRRLLRLAEALMSRLPIGRSVYSASKSVLEILSERQADAFKRVVLVEYPRRGIFSLAFVTSRVKWAGLHPDLADARTVFLPTTPNPTSGFLLVLPLAELIDVPISVEEGIRLVISGGILLPKSVDLAVPGEPHGESNG